MSEPFALVIEDDLDASNIFSKALEAAGCKTEIIAKGDVALQRLSECTPTLVVLDLHLPNVDGASILAQMRQDERHAKTIVMLATADPRMADTVRDLADLVLLKPVTFTQVRDFAIRLLRRVEVAKVEPAAAASAPTEPEPTKPVAADVPVSTTLPSASPAPAVLSVPPPAPTAPPAPVPYPVAAAVAPDTPAVETPSAVAPVTAEVSPVEPAQETPPPSSAAPE
jgi:CheY-like chemotaxis protein